MIKVMPFIEINGWANGWNLVLIPMGGRCRVSIYGVR